MGIFLKIFSLIIFILKKKIYLARKLSRDDIIRNIYSNFETGFGAINERLRKTKEQNFTINRVDVENFLRKQPNKQIRKYRGSNSYTPPLGRFEYRIDTMDMVSLVKNVEAKIPVKNDGPRYGLVGMDIFNQLVDVIPMKEKVGANTKTNLS